MDRSKLLKQYTIDQLSDDANYISIQEALTYFPWLTSAQSTKAIKRYIQSGQLLGRCLNTSPHNSPYQNQWQVFAPDIRRFKRTIVKAI